MIKVILILLLVVFLLFIYFTFFKVPKLKNLTFIDGGLGTGKSCLSVRFAIGTYRKQLLKFYIRNFLVWWDRQDEEPLLYSNIPLKNIKFVKLTKDIIYRTKRVNYKSVLLIDEGSLLVDQMDFKDDILSERLSEFYKLWRHETKGGFCIVNSQSISDMHYSFKYCISDYFYIHSRIRLPFISIMRLQEYAYSSDNNVIQVNDKDVEDNTKLFIIRNKYFKRYDSYCHSIYTDNLPIENKIEYIEDRKLLKSSGYLSFKKLSFIDNSKYKYYCSCCGAPLVRRDKTKVYECSYCNTIYDIKGVEEDERN